MCSAQCQAHSKCHHYYSYVLYEKYILSRKIHTFAGESRLLFSRYHGLWELQHSMLMIENRSVGIFVETNFLLNVYFQKFCYVLRYDLNDAAGTISVWTHNWSTHKSIRQESDLQKYVHIYALALPLSFTATQMMSVPRYWREIWCRSADRH